ncbi:hypothetical protein JD292_04745 [Leucobacter sp. CSA2]|uniref:Glyoxalase n=1 Tax=Leucobacter edaphi TaxID=2796472 RepID=A0A934QCR0_9MICO|nr:hypothetical protein [Leucobacter edaphi]MBK0421381.1 hypothetical protein [Leucobacter edaphi]
MGTSLTTGLIPELLVEDLDRSLGFWHTLCGFAIRYERLEDRLAYLELGYTQLVLEQRDPGGIGLTGALSPPPGRGRELRIAVPDSVGLAELLRGADWPFCEEPEFRKDVRRSAALRVHSFRVRDPDGHLARFQSSAPW